MAQEDSKFFHHYHRIIPCAFQFIIHYWRFLFWYTDNISSVAISSDGPELDYLYVNKAFPSHTKTRFWFCISRWHVNYIWCAEFADPSGWSWLTPVHIVSSHRGLPQWTPPYHSLGFASHVQRTFAPESLYWLYCTNFSPLTPVRIICAIRAVVKQVVPLTIGIFSCDWIVTLFLLSLFRFNWNI